MSKMKIEIQITFVTLLIALVVVASGYLGYKNLSKIIDSIHQAARPDNTPFIIKEIASGLSELENNARLYVLTNEPLNKTHYDSLYTTVNNKIQWLINEDQPTVAGHAIIDSFTALSFSKLEIWEGVIQLHESAKNLEPAFSQVYSKLETQKIDTIIQEQDRKGVFRKLFGKRKEDTIIVAHGLKKDEIQQLEAEIKEKGQQFNILESQLIKKNLHISEQLSSLIAKMEKEEAHNLVLKTQEADHLAKLTNRRLAAFSIAAVGLLFLVLFLLFNYLGKSRKYQKALQEAKTRAEDFARAKEQFAMNVSHELRTPVNVISGLAEQLLQKPMDDKAWEQLVVLSKSAQHLKTIVNDTLDFSKIQANKLKFDLVHFSPTGLFEEIIAIQRSEARSKGLELIVDIHGQMPEALLGDPLRLKQILLNLISNSIKFTESGHIIFRAEAFENAQGYILKMAIEDTGIGISQEDQQIIFDEFVQAENPSSKKYNGTGLGLSIVKKLVELQGGHILLESEPGKGTIFTIEIPYTKGLTEKIEKEELSEIKIPEAFKNLDILIVDDEKYNLFLLKGIFKKWGVSCHEATHGEKAVNLSVTKHYDLILMDLNMPGMDGLEATKKILDQKPGVKIIAITASNDQAIINNCLQAGMAGFLTKPFSEMALFKAIIDKLGIKDDSQSTTDNPPKKAQKIDFKNLKRLANNDEAFFMEMLQIFIQSTEDGASKLEQASLSDDYTQIAETAHKLAAPTKHLGATNLNQLLIALEKEAQTNKRETNIKELIMEIKKEIQATNQVILNFLGKTENS